MADQWMIKGREYGNCNCDQGCPCQFNAPSTHGHCQAVVAGIIDEGHFGNCDIAGLHWALVAKWPGEIAEGMVKSKPSLMTVRLMLNVKRLGLSLIHI